MKNIFHQEVTDEVIGRINQLTSETQPKWGKMDVAQMLAHCCVTYEFIFEPEKHPKPNPFMALIIKLVAKQAVVGEKPFKKNGATAPAFKMVDEKDFEKEKERLIEFLKKTQELGEAHFDGKESHSFGKLTKTEWNNMFYKHLDHHLTQFGV